MKGDHGKSTMILARDYSTVSITCVVSKNVTVENPRVCLICDKKCASYLKLNEHLLSKHNIQKLSRPNKFQCMLCNFQFGDKATYQKFHSEGKAPAETCLKCGVKLSGPCQKNLHAKGCQGLYI